MRALLTHRSWLLAAICCCGLLLPLRASAQQPQAPQQAQPASPEMVVTSFYKDPRPERLVGLFAQVQALPAAQNWESYPPLAGFFAFVFRAHPDQVDKLIPAKLDARSAETISAALRLSGQKAMYDKFQPRLAQAGRDADLTAAFAELPPRLEDLPITKPNHLDILWGAAFASGDPKFVSTIVEYFARTANLDESVALDVLRTVAAIAGGPKDILGELRARYGDVAARQVIFAASALFGIQTNARQHEFVARVVAKYIAEHPGTPAQKVLSATQPQAH